MSGHVIGINSVLGDFECTMFYEIEGMDAPEQIEESKDDDFVILENSLKLSK